jgi:methyl-accepting chemotaxis protein
MTALLQVRIGTKLLGGFLLLTMISIAISAVNSVRLAQIRDLQQNMYSMNIKPMKAVVDMTEAFQKTRVALRDLLLATTPEALDKAQTLSKDSNKAIDDALDSIDANSNTDKKEVQETRQSLAQYRAFQDKFIELTRAGKKDEANIYGRTPEIAQVIKGCAEQIKGLSSVKALNASKQVEGIIGITNAVLLQSIVCAVALLIIAIILGLFVTRSITRPIHELARKAEQLAGGDLTVSVAADSSDEIGALAGSFMRMADSLRDTLRKVESTSQQVATSSNQLHATSERIATGAEEVASQVQTVATASEELAATAGEIANNCHAVVQSSQQAGRAAQTGAAVVAQTVQVMTRIAERVNSTASTVESLGARSDQIGNIVGTIEDIADQTNLLALNAAIEAARAGEQGRGFAVVADEVRALAERTTKATREIGEMIKAVQAETKGAVVAMMEGVKEVRQGTEEASKSGAAIQDILDQIGAVSMQANQIATAAEEQTATTSEITHNLQQVSEVVHHTAQGSQESAAAAAQLSKNSEELRRLVQQFKL